LIDIVTLFGYIKGVYVVYKPTAKNGKQVKQQPDYSIRHDRQRDECRHKAVQVLALVIVHADR